MYVGGGRKQSKMCVYGIYIKILQLGRNVTKMELTCHVK